MKTTLLLCLLALPALAYADNGKKPTTTKSAPPAAPKEKVAPKSAPKTFPPIYDNAKAKGAPAPKAPAPTK